MGIIARAQKVKSIGAERGGGLVAVFGQDHLLDPMRGLFTQAHLDQATHDVSDHVVQKRIGFKIKPKISMRVAGAFSGDLKVVQSLDGRQGLTLCCPKGGEVMGAEQVRCRLLHAFYGHGFGDPTHALVLNAWANRALEEQVAVTPGGSALSGVKLRGNGVCPLKRNVMGQVTVRAAYPRAHLSLNRCIKVNHLQQGVNPSIGAPCAKGSDGRLSKGAKRFLELVLNCFLRKLALPSFILLTTVGQTQGNALKTHGLSFNQA